MDYITTTALRTQPPRVLRTLKQGQSVDLIHRSQVVGEIRPKASQSKPFDPERFEKLVKKLNFKPTTIKQREIIYGKHLEEKYGRYLRGR